MYTRIGRPRWGSVAVITALACDVTAIVLYCVAPQLFGDASVAFRNPEARPLFLAVLALAIIRAAPPCDETR